VRLHPLAPIIALDIDGTSGDYHEHLRWFAELYTQEPQEVHWDWSDHAEFSEALGMNKELYRQIKLAYRQGGMKRSMPAFPGIREFVETVRANGVQLWIATTRPWQRLDNIDPDTRFWIQRNIGRVDGVIYGEDKYLDLQDIAKERGQRIIGVFDDLPENIVAAQSIGLRACLRSGGHNERFRKSRPNTPIAHSSEDMLDIAMRWIRHDLDNEASTREGVA
jgi:FMN phosphatase YigB (HAD superfamily)